MLCVHIHTYIYMCVSVHVFICLYVYTHIYLFHTHAHFDPYAGDYEVVSAPGSRIMLEQSPEKQLPGDNAEFSSCLGMKRSAPSNLGDVKKPCHRVHSG